MPYLALELCVAKSSPVVPNAGNYLQVHLCSKWHLCPKDVLEPNSKLLSTLGLISQDPLNLRLAEPKLGRKFGY